MRQAPSVDGISGRFFAQIVGRTPPRNPHEAEACKLLLNNYFQDQSEFCTALFFLYNSLSLPDPL